MLNRRKSLSDEEIRSAGFRAQQAFMASPEFSVARVLALYSPIHGEVDTSEVLRTALKEGKIVLYPVVCGDGLRFIRVTDPDGLRKGAFGIPEPCLSGEAFPLDRTDVFVIPGVAFDLSGRRIGYGKGFYDRALHQFEGRGRLIGFCYDFQVVEEIAGEPHDVAIDVIVTDRRVIRPHGYHKSEEVQEN